MHGNLHLALKLRKINLHNLRFCSTSLMHNILHRFSEAEKQGRMAALLEKLHAKHNASRPWQETCKVVRQAMVRRRHLSLKKNKLYEFTKQFFISATCFAWTSGISRCGPGDKVSFLLGVHWQNKQTGCQTGAMVRSELKRQNLTNSRQGREKMSAGLQQQAAKVNLVLEFFHCEQATVSTWWAHDKSALSTKACR